MEKKPVIVLDLDDTLYCEEDYVRSGFREVDRYLKTRLSVSGFYGTALALHETGHRGRVINEALEQLKVPVVDELVPLLVQVYRSHRPEIRLDNEDREILVSLRKQAFLAVITDGVLETQTQKAHALGLLPLIDQFCCTGQWGRDYWKPHPRAFRHIMECWPQPSPAHYAYVADNPTKDFTAPRQLGWKCVHIARKGGLYCTLRPESEAHAAHCEIQHLREVAHALAKIGFAEPDVSS